MVFTSGKKFGEISMRTSFCIWLARNSKVWSPDLDLTEVKPTVKTSEKSKDELPSEPSKASSKGKVGLCNQVNTCHAGFINKGNTCYANSILQVLSVIPTL